MIASVWLLIWDSRGNPAGLPKYVREFPFPWEWKSAGISASLKNGAFARTRKDLEILWFTFYNSLEGMTKGSEEKSVSKLFALDFGYPSDSDTNSGSRLMLTSSLKFFGLLFLNFHAVISVCFLLFSSHELTLKFHISFGKGRVKLGH